MAPSPAGHWGTTGRDPGSCRHSQHSAAVPSAVPHDRRVQNAGPGQTHPVGMAGNSPVYSHGCKSPLPVAEMVAGKPICRAPGRILYFRHSSQGVLWVDAVRLCIPDKHGGEWLFTKTRVPVSALFGNLAAGAAIKEKVSSIMNDPRVVALHYCIEHESSVDYSNAEPVDHEEEGFRIRIEERLVCFEMKDDQPTVDCIGGGQLLH